MGWWRRRRHDPQRLKLIMSFAGVSLALAAVVLDRTWFTGTAIAVLSLAVLLRLALRRRGRAGTPPGPDGS